MLSFMFIHTVKKLHTCKLLLHYLVELAIIITRNYDCIVRPSRMCLECNPLYFKYSSVHIICIS